MNKEDVVHIYNGISLNHNKITPFATTLVHVSQREKDKYHTISLICGILKKMIQMNLFTKQKQTYRIQKQTWLQRGNVGVGGRDKLGVRD